jgi:hypothetical protein
MAKLTQLIRTFRSEHGMAEHTRATKHIKKSQGSLAEVSLAEVRKSFWDETGYQIHPK